MFSLSRLGVLLLALIVMIPGWAATESLIYFTSFQDNHEAIFVVGSDGKNPRLLLPDEIHPRFNAFLANSNRRGTAVVYNADTPHFTQIFIVKPDGTGKVQLTTQGNNYTPGLSPDGKLVVFHSLRDDHREIYLVKSDGSGEKRLTHTAKNVQNRNASFSPDGKRIIFQSDRSGAWRIYSMKVNGSKVKCLTSNVSGTEPTYSADGKYVTFVNAMSQVCVMNSDGSQLRTITNDTHPASRPTFSPDGKTIVYQSGPFYESNLLLINVDGSHAHRLFSNGPLGWSPWWAGEVKKSAE